MTYGLPASSTLRFTLSFGGVCKYNVIIDAYLQSCKNSRGNPNLFFSSYNKCSSCKKHNTAGLKTVRTVRKDLLRCTEVLQSDFFLLDS